MGYNFYEMTELLRKLSLNHPFCNNVYFEKYKINATNDIEYPAMIYLHNGSHIGENVTTHNFNILYVDRLTQEKDNRREIQSVGIQVISEIVNTLRVHFDMDVTTDLEFNVFNEQYADSTAGAISNVQIVLPSDIGTCSYINCDVKSNCER